MSHPHTRVRTHSESEIAAVTTSHPPICPHMQRQVVVTLSTRKGFGRPNHLQLIDDFFYIPCQGAACGCTARPVLQPRQPHSRPMPSGPAPTIDPCAAQGLTAAIFSCLAQAPPSLFPLVASIRCRHFPAPSVFRSTRLAPHHTHALCCCVYAQNQTLVQLSSGVW